MKILLCLLERSDISTIGSTSSMTMGWHKRFGWNSKIGDPPEFLTKFPGRSRFKTGGDAGEPECLFWWNGFMSYLFLLEKQVHHPVVNQHVVASIMQNMCTLWVLHGFIFGITGITHNSLFNNCRHKPTHLLWMHTIITFFVTHLWKINAFLWLSDTFCDCQKWFFLVAFVHPSFLSCALE